MGGGSGGGNTTTTQKADPWIGVQPYLTQGYQQLSSLYQPGQGPQYYPGQTVATPNDLERIGQENQLMQGGNLAALGQWGQNSIYDMATHGTNATGQGYNQAIQGGAGLSNVAGQAQAGIGGANAAMSQLLGYGGNGTTQAGAMGQMNAMNQLAQAGDFGNNPAFQAALQSAIRPVTQQFQEQVMPGINQGAQAAGQLGGSRQGIAEGIASRGYMDTVGDISANMGNAAYAQGLQALQASGQLGQGLTSQGLGALGAAGGLGSGLGNLAGSAYGNLGSLGQGLFGAGTTAMGQSVALTPAAQQAQLAAGKNIEGIGQQWTANQQDLINADMARYNYGQNLPYGMIQDYLNTLNGAASLGGSQTSQQSGGGGSRMTGALGGAATGAAIGSAVPGIGTGIGAGVGALYGLFM